MPSGNEFKLIHSKWRMLILLYKYACIYTEHRVKTSIPHTKNEWSNNSKITLYDECFFFFLEWQSCGYMPRDKSLMKSYLPLEWLNTKKWPIFSVSTASWITWNTSKRKAPHFTSFQWKRKDFTRNGKKVWIKTHSGSLKSTIASKALHLIN